MASRFLKSSHAQRWLLDPSVVADSTKIYTECGVSQVDVAVIFTRVGRVLASVCKKTQLRYRVCGTAMIYLRRIYTLHSMKHFNIFIFAAACLNLAARVEESHHKRQPLEICDHFKNILGKDLWEFNLAQMLTIEPIVMQILKFDLVVHHPHHDLLALVESFPSTKKDEILKMAWGIVNDSYQTPMHLLYPPDVIALAAFHVAGVECGEPNLVLWLKGFSMNTLKMFEATKHIIKLYRILTQLHGNVEKRATAAFRKLKMPRGITPAEEAIENAKEIKRYILKKREQSKKAAGEKKAAAAAAASGAPPVPKRLPPSRPAAVLSAPPSPEQKPPPPQGPPPPLAPAAPPPPSKTFAPPGKPRTVHLARKPVQSHATTSGGGYRGQYGNGRY